MTYETNERILTLTEVRRRERNIQKEKLDIEAKELLLKVISFYDENYPNSEHNNIWQKPKIKVEIGKHTLDDELESLNEESLHNMFEIFTYFHDERQMKLVKEHNLKTRTLAIVKKLIPGGRIQEELYELHKKQAKNLQRTETLELELIEKRKEFKERIEQDKKWKPVYLTCNFMGKDGKVCGKVCKSAAGLKSHSRKHEDE